MIWIYFFFNNLINYTVFIYCLRRLTFSRWWLVLFFLFTFINIQIQLDVFVVGWGLCILCYVFCGDVILIRAFLDGSMDWYLALKCRRFQEYWVLLGFGIAEFGRRLFQSFWRLPLLCSFFFIGLFRLFVLMIVNVLIL